MTADTITAIKKALRDLSLLPWDLQLDDSVNKPVVAVMGKWAICSDAVNEDGFTALAEYVETVAPMRMVELLSTLESLRRDNEELRQGKDHIAAEKAGIAKNAHSNVDYWKSQYEASEAKLKRFTYLLEKVAPPEFSKSWLPPQDYEMIRTALSSTGDTHE